MKWVFVIFKFGRPFQKESLQGGLRDPYMKKVVMQNLPRWLGVRYGGTKKELDKWLLFS